VFARAGTRNLSYLLAGPPFNWNNNTVAGGGILIATVLIGGNESSTAQRAHGRTAQRNPKTFRTGKSSPRSTATHPSAAMSIPSPPDSPCESYTFYYRIRACRIRHNNSSCSPSASACPGEGFDDAKENASSCFYRDPLTCTPRPWFCFHVFVFGCSERMGGTHVGTASDQPVGHGRLPVHSHQLRAAVGQ
jgi:hypothetical protein